MDLTDAEFVEACNDFLADDDAGFDEAITLDLEATERGLATNPLLSFNDNVRTWAKTVEAAGWSRAVGVLTDPKS